jgi:diamine N-acetyltransferase
MVPRCTSRGSPERTVPRSFYRKLGFQLTGEKSEGQTVGVLDLTNA